MKVRLIIVMCFLGAFCSPSVDSKKTKGGVPAKELPTSSLESIKEVEIFFNRLVDDREFAKYRKKAFATDSLEKHGADFVTDRSLDTAWCFSGSKDASPSLFTLFSPSHIDSRELEGQKFVATIVPGFGLNDEIYLANNRVKKAVLEIYEAELGESELVENVLGSKPVLNSRWELNLNDKEVTQSFAFVLKRRMRYSSKYASAVLLARLQVIDVFPGLKYKDTCISEFRVNKRSW